MFMTLCCIFMCIYIVLFELYIFNNNYCELVYTSIMYCHRNFVSQLECKKSHDHKILGTVTTTGNVSLSVTNIIKRIIIMNFDDEETKTQ